MDQESNELEPKDMKGTEDSQLLVQEIVNEVTEAVSEKTSQEPLSEESTKDSETVPTAPVTTLSHAEYLRSNPLLAQPGLVTEEEATAVEKVKLLFLEAYPEPSKHFTNTCFLRFHRGLKGREDVVLRKLISTQKWRLENDVDNILSRTEEFPRPIASRVTSFPGKDKNGRPFAYCFSHRHNAYDRDVEQMRKYIIYTSEYLLSQTLPHEERFCIYFDLGRFSLNSMDYEVVKSLVDILQNNYQETLEKLFVIDAPFIFSACWVIIRAWLDPVTAAKVQFIKRDQLLETLDESLIPKSD